MLLSRDFPCESLCENFNPKCVNGMENLSLYGKCESSNFRNLASVEEVVKPGENDFESAGREFESLRARQESRG